MKRWHTARMLSPGQCRAARGFLRWSLQELSERAGVAVPTISRFENEHSAPTRATLAVLQRAFEDAGIEFLNSDAPGVRLKRGK